MVRWNSARIRVVFAAEVKQFLRVTALARGVKSIGAGRLWRKIFKASNLIGCLLNLFLT